MFRVSQIGRLSSLSAVVLGASLFCARADAAVEKERVLLPVKNDDVAGTNANAFRGELRGAHKFYSWSGTNQLNALLFNNGANDGQGLFVENFTAPNVVGSGAFMLFDSIRDKGGEITRKAEPGVSLGPSTLRIAGAGGRDVITKLDPLNKRVRRPVGNLQGESTGFEVVLENASAESISLDWLSVRINNTDELLDFSTPFIPDGAPVAMVPSFVPTVLAPGDSIAYSYSGSFDESLPISVLASSTAGADSFTGMLASPVPEPASLGVIGCLALPLLRRWRAHG